PVRTLARPPWTRAVGREVLSDGVVCHEPSLLEGPQVRRSSRRAGRPRRTAVRLAVRCAGVRPRVHGTEQVEPYGPGRGTGGRLHGRHAPRRPGRGQPGTTA